MLSTFTAALALLAAGASAPPAAPAFRTHQVTPLLDFTFSWPREAAAIPGVRARLQAEMQHARAEALHTAQDDRAARDRGTFLGHSFSESWESRGRSRRLAVFSSLTDVFEGGAHGNQAYDSLIWDLGGNRAVTLTDVMGGGWQAAFRARFCNGINRERARRRGAPVHPTQNDDFLTGCPRIGDVTLVPADADHDGRFEHLRVLIAPYVAGPYAEGTYEFSIPLSAADVARVPPPYRTSFAAAAR